MHALTSALPLHARLPLGVALVLALTAADALVYGATIGLGFALFLCALSALAGLSADDPPTKRGWAVAAAGQGLAVLPLLLQSNVLTLAIALVGTLAVCLSQRGMLRGGWASALAEVALQCAMAPARFVPLWRSLGRAIVSSSPRTSLVLWVVPTALATLFVFLFADANPIIADAIEAIDLWALLAQLFGERVWFWLGMAVLVAPFLHPAVREAPRVRGLLGALSLVRRPKDEDELLATLKGEAGFATRCLALFNAVFAVQTATDLVYLYGGAALPAGMTFAEYAHRGAYPLLLTAILAGLFVIWTTRPLGPASTSPLVTKLVLLWVAQNVLLLVSSVLRLDLYVEAMGLTYWRVAAFVWMGLTGLGFALVLVRGFRGHSLGWLFASNAAALLVTLYVVGCVNWASIIAHSQLMRDGASLPGAAAYVRRIGPEALPAVVAFRADVRTNMPEMDRWRLARLERDLRQGLWWQIDGSGQRSRYGWRSLTLRRRALEKVVATAYPAFVPQPKTEVAP